MEQRSSFNPIKGCMLLSESEWNARNSCMSNALIELVRHYVRTKTNRGLDIGCAEGVVADAINATMGLTMCGVDPVHKIRHTSSGGSELLPGSAEHIPYPDSYFDCAILANVYEHIPPNSRKASLQEIERVLVKNGLLIGQLPNPRFPIEAHSRLPFMGFLPRSVQLKYWQIAPVKWKPSVRWWFPVSINELTKGAESLGFETVHIRKFGYTVDVFPASLHWMAELFGPVIRCYPFAWQFVFRRT